MSAFRKLEDTFLHLLAGRAPWVLSPNMKRRVIAERILEVAVSSEYGMDAREAARAVAMMMGIDMERD